MKERNNSRENDSIFNIVKKNQYKYRFYWATTKREYFIVFGNAEMKE